MHREYSVNFSYDNIQKNTKGAYRTIEKKMEAIGAKTTYKSEEGDDWTDLTFSVVNSLEKINAVIDDVFNTFRSRDVNISSTAKIYTPKINLTISEFGDENQLMVMVEKSDNEMVKSMKKFPTDNNIMSLSFEKTADKDTFVQTLLENTRSNGLNINVEKDWEEVPVIDRNNYVENKKKVTY